jgi:phosphonopyruvate decarboxylase
VVHPEEYLLLLKHLGVGPYAGVPCSMLSGLINYLLGNPQVGEYYPAVNEGQALAFGAGTYLATKKLPLVFLQNSGFGNLINPLASLNQIYEIPALLMITWRGQGGRGTDAPEHDIVGENMLKYLDVYEIPYEVLSCDDFAHQTRCMVERAKKTRLPTAVVITKGFFDSYELINAMSQPSSLERYEAIRIIKEQLNEYLFLSTTAYISRESFSIRPSADFYMMGSMGLIGAIGAGVALYSQDKKIALLDGDGAILMHLGLIPFIGYLKPKNLLHVILDNEAYSSTNDQPTISGTVDFSGVAKNCGYNNTARVANAADLQTVLADFSPKDGPSLVHVKVKRGNQKEIDRVSEHLTCPEVTEKFMRNFLKSIRE